MADNYFPTAASELEEGEGQINILLLLVPAMIATILVMFLVIAQTDQFARRFLLKPDQLQRRRLVEYKYRWDQSLEKSLLRAQMYFAGGIHAHTEQQLEHQQSSSARTRTSTSAIWDESGLTYLIQEWIQQDKEKQIEGSEAQPLTGNDSKTFITPFPRILGMTREGQNEENYAGGGEILIELYHPQSGNYQLPFERFGLVLADLLQEEAESDTPTPMCFVADASSGLASQVVADLVQESRTPGVAIIREPIWMTSFAYLAAQKVMSQEKMQNILFGLIHMEAMRVLAKKEDPIIGENAQQQTILFTIPGQSITHIMLPLLHQAFPTARHIFGYQDCIESIERAMALRNRYKRATVPRSLEEAISYSTKNNDSSDPTRYTTPMKSNLATKVGGGSSGLLGYRTPTIHLMNYVNPLAVALAKLRLYHADVTEAWMSSMNTCGKLNFDEDINPGQAYNKPYVLKLSSLIGRLRDGDMPVWLDDDDDDDDGLGRPQKDSDRYNKLHSLLHFVTATERESLPEGVLDAGKEWLRDYIQKLRAEVQTYPKLNQTERDDVSDCTCQLEHKLILLMQ